MVIFSGTLLNEVQKFEDSDNEVDSSVPKSDKPSQIMTVFPMSRETRKVRAVEACQQRRNDRRARERSPFRGNNRIEVGFGLERVSMVDESFEAVKALEFVFVADLC